MKNRPLALLLIAPLLSTAARAQTFQPGDFWIVSQGLDNGGAFPPGIGRVDIATGSAHFVVQAVTTFLGVSTFDTFRNGLVTAFRPIGAPNIDVRLVHADGSSVPIAPFASGVLGLAAVGDGRIYMFRSHTPPSVEYLDAANVLHDLLDAAGTAPFLLSGTNVERTMFFDSATSSLFMGTQLTGTPCVGGSAQAAVIKIPISADGTKVAGAVQTSTFCVANASSATRIVNFSDGPGGALIAVIDDNSNSAVGRVVAIDKTTLAATTYASNGPYTGAAATVAGVYSHALGKVVIDDGFSVLLRLYGLGESGAGTTYLTGGVSVHADASMVEIPTTVMNGLTPYGTGTPGCKSAQALFATSAPKVGAANFRFTCTNAPASALGLLIVGDVPDLAGSDPFALGALFHVNLFASTFLTGLDVNSDAAGFAQSPAPIPIMPSFVGSTVDAQALWVWTGCATPSPFGISTSTGLAVTFQP